MFDIKLEDLK